MSIDEVKPHAGSHAIQNVLFLVEWESDLRLDELMDIQTGVRAHLQSEFPTVHAQQMFVMQIPQDGVSPPSPQASIGGFSLTSLPNGAGAVARQIDISLKSVSIVINDYTRWDRVWADARRYLTAVLDTLKKHREVKKVVLQYTDAFYWNSSLPFPTAAVFRQESKFLPANIFSLDDLWHVYQGYFLKVTEPLLFKQLDNLNISLIDQDNRKALFIVASHQAHLDGPLAIDDDSKTRVEALICGMHDQNKDMLREILSEDVCAKISLN